MCGTHSKYCADLVAQLLITELLWSHLVSGFSFLDVLSVAIDIPPGVVDIGQVARALLPLQLGKD